MGVPSPGSGSSCLHLVAPLLQRPAGRLRCLIFLADHLLVLLLPVLLCWSGLIAWRDTAQANQGLCSLRRGTATLGLLANVQPRGVGPHWFSPSAFGRWQCHLGNRFACLHNPSGVASDCCFGFGSGLLIGDDQASEFANNSGIPLKNWPGKRHDLYSLQGNVLTTD